MFKVFFFWILISSLFGISLGMAYILLSGSIGVVGALITFVSIIFTLLLVYRILKIL